MPRDLSFQPRWFLVAAAFETAASLAAFLAAPRHFFRRRAVQTKFPQKCQQVFVVLGVHFQIENVFEENGTFEVS